MVEMPFADAKTHSQLAANSLRNRSQVDRFLQRGVRFSVCIEGGLMDGLSSQLYARSCTIGASLRSDIVLFDEGIEDNHIELTFKSSIFGPVLSVRALASGVEVANEPLERGKVSKYQALPLVINVNNIPLTIEPQQNSGRTYNPIIVQTWHYSRYPILAVSILLLAVQLMNGPNFNFEVAMTQDPLPYNIVQRRESELQRLQIAATSVQEKLDELELAEYLDVSLDSSGAVGLNGMLRSDKEIAWKQFRRWYDENETSVLLSRVTMAPDLTEFPAISSVKLNEPQLIKLRSGAQIRIGDVIHNGLKLKEVNKGYLILDDDGEDLMISFNGQELSDG